MGMIPSNALNPIPQENGIMNFGQAIIGGIIGGVITLLVCWLLFSVFGLALIESNVYTGVTIAGFFSAFFAVIFNCKSCSSND